MLRCFLHFISSLFMSVQAPYLWRQWAQTSLNFTHILAPRKQSTVVDFDKFNSATVEMEKLSFFLLSHKTWDSRDRVRDTVQLLFGSEMTEREEHNFSSRAVSKNKLLCTFFVNSYQHTVDQSVCLCNHCYCGYLMLLFKSQNDILWTLYFKASVFPF